MKKISYSQHFEDVYIERVFSDVSRGFYVDIGAYHPSADSVTRHFYEKGWRGINVEPGPGFAEFKSRDRDINLQLAIADCEGEVYYRYDADHPGTSSVIDESQAANGSAELQKVNCITLERLFEQYVRGEHVHFLKLDIEGSEEPVIMSTDWKKIRPELLIVESVLPMTNRRCDAAWRPYLIRSDYREVFFDGVNVYFLRDESMHRSKDLNRPVNVLDGFSKYSSADYRLEILNKDYLWIKGRFADAEKTIEKLNLDLAWLQQRYAELIEHSGVVTRHRDEYEAWLRDLLRRTEEDRDLRLQEIGLLKNEIEKHLTDLRWLQERFAEAQEITARQQLREDKP